MSEQTEQTENNLQPLTEHLKALRRVFLISLIAVFVSSILCYGFLREPIMSLVTAPMAEYDIELKFTSVAEAFMAYMKISILAGVIFASPIVLWQILKFVLPGLYENEKKAFLTMLFWLFCLFLAGVCFAYFVVLKVALYALLFNFSGEFDPFITVANYLSFVGKFLIPFGIVFEIPLLIYFLTKFDLVTPESLVKYRRHIILVIVIAAGVFSPPDVVSQALLALPMYVLYEISIVISRRVYKKKLKKAMIEETTEG
ncbi:MAG: twin-arginine translocase subunit TatC [Peptococcaceae bacterium]|nr:twin-arginine translocase subunit TatC [Peptococcaceae bacterium]